MGRKILHRQQSLTQVQTESKGHGPVPDQDRRRRKLLLRELIVAAIAEKYPRSALLTSRLNELIVSSKGSSAHR